MKKLIAPILICTVLLTACHNNKPVENVEETTTETTTTIEEQTEEPKTEIVETSQNTIIEDAQDFRKVVEEEMEKHHIQGSLEEEYNKVMQYSNDMTKLEDDYANIWTTIWFCIYTYNSVYSNNDFYISSFINKFINT